MKVLIIGGTGLISRGIVKHLLTRGAQVTMFNRGQAENTLPPEVEQIRGDRRKPAEFEERFRSSRYDVVIDMICFGKEDAESTVRAFAGRCEQFQFCSTVASYGVKIPDHVLIDESFVQQPISDYGRNKVICEQIFLEAHQQKKFNTTIFRPSNTYGEGKALIDQIEFNPVSWDRIERGEPVLCADGGVALWQSTHRDDCGLAFAYGALNSKTYGECYNTTRDRIFTWRDYFREAALALGKPALLLSMPSAWIVKHHPSRFNFLKDISSAHGAYSSEKAKRHIPEYRCNIDFKDGARRTLLDMKERNALPKSADDALYQSMIDAALRLGFEPEPA